MAEKRFYWLKLKEDYFSSPKIKKLRKIAGGDTYTIIYLKMQLLSIKNQGIIQFEGIEKTLEEELALKLDEDIDNVKITLNYLKAQNLIEENNNEFLLLDASNNIGSECQSAERVRSFREREQALQCNTHVTQMLQNSISISNSKSISNIKETKHKYGTYERILLSDSEYQKLCNEFGKDYTDFVIEKIDEYVQSNDNKNKYKDFNLVIRKAIREKWSILKENKETKFEDNFKRAVEELYGNS